MGTPVRLNRFLSMAGVTSRRKADELISSGRVGVNGRTVTDLGTKVDPAADAVFLDGRQVVLLDPGIYIVLNKPKDTITTLSDERGRRSVRDYVGLDRRVFPVGRLDRHTTGVLILTNDGEFANLLMHPRNKVPKSYLVTADRAVLPDDVRRLARGVALSDGPTAPCEASIVPKTRNTVVGVTLREGRNRQVHRMFEAIGYEVRKLERVAYGPLTCEGLPRGRWRHLLPAEVRALRSAAGGERRPAGAGSPGAEAAPAPGRRRPGRERPAPQPAGRRVHGSTGAGRGRGGRTPGGSGSRTAGGSGVRATRGVGGRTPGGSGSRTTGRSGGRRDGGSAGRSRGATRGGRPRRPGPGDGGRARGRGRV